MKTLLLALVLLCSSPLPALAWELNQLAILFPLPERGAGNSLWGPGTKTQAGPPLPRAVYDDLPTIAQGRDREWLYGSLRVVAVRIDPCFREGDGPCQKQLRFVWQPVEQGPDGTWQTLDAAVHTFHVLSDDAWNALTADLAELNGKFPLPPDQPIGVHPWLRAQGPGGAFGLALARVLFRYAKEENFARATAMTVNREGTIWVFTGFDVNGREHRRIAIPKTDNVAQAFFTGLFDSPEFAARMNPEPPEKSFLRLLRDSWRAKQEMSPAELVEVFRRALEFGNPRLSNPGTLDCASCHAARSLPEWGRTNFPGLEWEKLFQREIFRGPGNLVNTTVRPARTNVLRAFGYFGRDPVISPRLVHEASLGLERMNGQARSNTTP
jgi:hypothetical protein